MFLGFKSRKAKKIMGERELRKDKKKKEQEVGQNRE